MKTSNFARFNPNRITVQSSAYAREEANSLLVDHEIRSGNIPKLENLQLVAILHVEKISGNCVAAHLDGQMFFLLLGLMIDRLR